MVMVIYPFGSFCSLYNILYRYKIVIISFWVLLGKPTRPNQTGNGVVNNAAADFNEIDRRAFLAHP